MISFKIDDQFLDTPLNQTIGMIYRGSVLDYTSTLGSRSFQIMFPFTSKNDLIFKNARFTFVKSSIKQFECQSFFNGVTLHSGRLVLMRSTASYECFFYPNSSTESSQDLLINEIELFNQTVNLGSTQIDVIEASHTDMPDDGYGWPTFWLPEFYDGKNEFWRSYVNPKTKDFGTGLTYSILENVINTGEARNLYAFAPQLYLSYVLRRVAEALGYEATGDLFDYSRFNSAFVFNNTPLDELDENLFVTEIRQDPEYYITGYFRPDFTTISGGDYVVGGTYSSGGGPTLNYKGYEAQSDGMHRVSITSASIAGFIPGVVQSKNYKIRQTVYLKLINFVPGTGYVLAHVWEISTYSGQVLISSPGSFDIWTPHDFQMYENQRAYFEVEVLRIDEGTFETSPVSFDIFDLSVKFENLETTQLNILKKSFNKKDLLPEVTIKDFLANLRKWVGVITTFNESNKTLDFSLVVNLMNKDDHEDWSSKVIDGYSQDFSQGKNYEWKLPDDDLQNQKVKVTSPILTDQLEQIVPSISGFTKEYVLDDTEKLLVGGSFWKSTSKAISPMYDQEGNNREARFVADFAALVSETQKPVAETIANAATVTLSLNLSLTDVMNLDFKKKKMINGTSYFLRELRVPFENQKIGIAVAELIKLE
jgi:hypothetical protein